MSIEGISGQNGLCCVLAHTCGRCLVHFVGRLKWRQKSEFFSQRATHPLLISGPFSPVDLTMNMFDSSALGRADGGGRVCVLAARLCTQPYGNRPDARPVGGAKQAHESQEAHGFLRLRIPGMVTALKSQHVCITTVRDHEWRWACRIARLAKSVVLTAYVRRGYVCFVCCFVPGAGLRFRGPGE